MRMRKKSPSPLSLLSILVVKLLIIPDLVNQINGSEQFNVIEATIDDIQKAFVEGHVTSSQLVDLYLERIRSLNPVLRSVVEVNPNARDEAEEADRVRASSAKGAMHGIPVLLKDSIATKKDKMNNSAGSYALVGATAAREAHVVEKLREAGAVILGKASLSEWYGTRSTKAPSNWCARAGLAMNPYVKRGDPCGSSYGSAISVAANMVTVSLGTETHGSIIVPSDHNSVVGIKPTVGLTSRAGVIPITPRQDTIGPICRTVSDAVHVLDAIVGFDPRDYEATSCAAKFIPDGGYKQFLKMDGLKAKRLGVVRNRFSKRYQNSVFDHHLQLFRERGATVVDNLEIPNWSIIQNASRSGEKVATSAEFKLSINKYLKEELIASPVRSLSDIIQFNIHHPHLEKTEEYGQDLLIESEMTSGISEEVREAVKRMEELSKNGFEKIMKENELDGLVTLGVQCTAMLAIGGYPAISVPAGYDDPSGMPFGICFGGLKGTEPKLIEIAYDFEQSTLVRKPPRFFTSTRSFDHSSLQLGFSEDVCLVK